MKSTHTLLWPALGSLLLLLGPSLQAGPLSLSTTNKAPAQTPPSCNADLIRLYANTQASKPEDISQFCPSVEKSCCSIFQVQELIDEFVHNKKEIVAIFDEAKTLINQARGIKITPMRKFLEDWRVVPMKFKTKVGNAEEPLLLDTVAGMQNEIADLADNYSVFLENQFRMTSSFACTMCNAKHGQDFRVDNASHKIDQVRINTAHCYNIFQINFELKKSFDILGKWITIANIVDYVRKRKIRFSYDDYMTRGQWFFDNLKTCYYNAEKRSKTELTLNCEILCQKLFSVNSIIIPFQIVSVIQYVLENINEHFYSVTIDAKANKFQNAKYHVTAFKNTLNPNAPKPESLVIQKDGGVNYVAEELDNNFGPKKLFGNAAALWAKITLAIALLLI